ncbi:SRPBCC family protein [Candidatus Leptofilum sp.]|uniref:SRPBCC family protein n=1 Tax=Candidatus Leptofilum sp. TaxID=3241576 RepID=UPI003B59F128
MLDAALPGLGNQANHKKILKLCKTALVRFAQVKAGEVTLLIFKNFPAFTRIRKKIMQITRATTVNVSADKVWKILGTDFNNISEWASVVLDSEAIPDMPTGSGRICNVKGIGNTLEKLTSFDDDQRKFSFTFENSKIPFFVRKIENTWSVTPKGSDQATVQVNADVNLMPVFRQLMGGMMSRQLGKGAESLLGELKHFAENDKPKA